jgi:hypothetical protein
MDSNLRTDNHKRSKTLEELLHKINGMFDKPEQQSISHLTQPELPAIFIIHFDRASLCETRLMCSGFPSR